MKKRFLLFLLPLWLTSCEKLLLEKDPANDPVANFELMWKTLDENYAFFTYKNIDWDSVYREYRQQVEPDMHPLELFRILSDMLYALRDGHVNLISTFNFSRNWEWYLDYPENFNRSLLERNYWGSNYDISGPLINTVIDSVGYIYYGSFAGAISPANIDYVLLKFEALKVKGVIIDIRNNGGGNLSNAERLASRFADQKRLAYQVYYKNGPGHDDFYDTPIPHYVEPDGPRQFTQPVVVLTNRRCFSASTFFVQQMRVLPHVTIMGDRTGGGGGLPIYSELPNGWRYRYSTTIATDPDGFNFENGIPPDTEVALHPDAEAGGTDTILEEALEMLR